MAQRDNPSVGNRALRPTDYGHAVADAGDLFGSGQTDFELIAIPPDDVIPAGGKTPK
jgi:hypothetical protein